MDVDSLVQELRRQFRPGRRSPVPERFLALLNSLLAKRQVKAEAVLGGSYAKGTYLEGDHDVDVFVRFAKGVPDASFADLLASALEGLAGVRRIHGSRDYFQLSWEGFFFELVPVLALDDAAQAVNVTDVSPLHVGYVRDRLRKKPLLADDIRLVKLFCKAAKVYGAESYINGFSGHVLDLLVIQYGSLLGLLAAAAAWPAKVFVDPSGKRRDALLLPEAKRLSPLVLLDPIQPARNAAAALSKECYDRFRTAAKEFLKSPSREFFVAKPLSKAVVVARFPSKPSLCYALAALADQSKDIAGTKLLKAHRYLVRQARLAGFGVLGEGFEFDGREAFCFLVVEREPLASTFVRDGPPASQKLDAERFRQAHRGREVFEQGGRLQVRLQRPFTTLAGLFGALATGEYVKGRSSRAKII